jgi:hypothetical protein
VQVVEWVPVLDGRRAPGENVRVALHEGIRIFAFDAIHQRGIPVHVVEVLEQSKAIHLSQIRVRFAFRHTRGDLDCDLLEANGGFEGRLVRRIEPVHERLLMLLDTAHLREGLLQILVHAGTRMREPQRFRLNTIHQNHAHAREGVVVEFAIGPLDQVLPCKALPRQRHALVLK